MVKKKAPAKKPWEDEEEAPAGKRPVAKKPVAKKRPPAKKKK